MNATAILKKGVISILLQDTLLDCCSWFWEAQPSQLAVKEVVDILQEFPETKRRDLRASITAVPAIYVTLSILFKHLP